MKYTKAGDFPTHNKGKERFKKKRFALQTSVGMIAVGTIFVLGSLTSTLFNDADGSALHCEKNICEMNHELMSFGYCVYTTEKFNCTMMGSDHCSASSCSPWWWPF